MFMFIFIYVYPNMYFILLLSLRPNRGLNRYWLNICINHFGMRHVCTMWQCMFIQRRAWLMLQVGGHIEQGLRALKEKHSIIGDVRGKGLMLGVELVKDRQTKVSQQHCHDTGIEQNPFETALFCWCLIIEYHVTSCYCWVSSTIRMRKTPAGRMCYALSFVPWFTVR